MANIFLQSMNVATSYRQFRAKFGLVAEIQKVVCFVTDVYFLVYTYFLGKMIYV